MMQRTASGISVGILACTIFTAASAQDTVLENMTEMAGERLAHHDQALALCDEVNNVIAPELAEAGIERELRGEFNAGYNAGNFSCEVTLGRDHVNKYDGQYISDRTNRELSRDILDKMNYDELVKVRDNLPALSR